MVGAAPRVVKTRETKRGLQAGKERRGRCKPEERSDDWRMAAAETKPYKAWKGGGAITGSATEGSLRGQKKLDSVAVT